MAVRAGMREDNAYQVEALAKGLRILALFSDRQPALRLKEVAALTGLPMPTAFRLVATLVTEGFLERLSDGLVRPGTNVLTLGFAALSGADLVQHSERLVRELAARTKQTVNVGVLAGDEVLYVVRIYSTALVTANVTVGSRLPAVVTSMGKLLLAYTSDAVLKQTIGAKAFSNNRGPNATRSLAALRRQFATIKANGYAIQDEEVAHGLRSIAGPVRNVKGDVIAAVNVAVPAAEFSVDSMIEAFRDPLLAVCRQISRRLGAPA